MNEKKNELKINPHQYYAVLTGDVISSSKLNEAARRNLPDALAKTSKAARALFGNVVMLDADVFRGDSWQLVLSDAKLCFRVALFFRAHLHAYSSGVGLDTRIAIGVGTIDFLPKQRVSQGDGDAFRESGRTLESMPTNRRLAFSAKNQAIPTSIDPMLALVDVVMNRWTEKQALAVVGMLQGSGQSEIAKLWTPAIRQPVVARHLRQAGWEALTAGLVYFENTLKELFQRK